MPIDRIAGQAAADEIEGQRIRAFKNNGVSVNKLIRELGLIAFSDMRDYVEIAEGGEVQAIPLDAIKKEKSRAIKKVRDRTKISESADGERLFKESTLEYELYDKLDSLKYLCALIGAEPAKRVSNPDGSNLMEPLADAIRAARTRAKGGE